MDVSEVDLRRRGLVSYARLAESFAADLGDWRFAVRLLRETVLQARALVDQEDLDAFHHAPPSTGSRGWDSVLAGAAVLTGAGRVSPGILDWSDDPRLRCDELFDPLSSGKYLLLESLRTPAPIRERNVVLAAGNLEGA